MLCGDLHSHATVMSPIDILLHIVQLTLHARATCMIEVTDTNASRPHSMITGSVHRHW